MTLRPLTVTPLGVLMVLAALACATQAQEQAKTEPAAEASKEKDKDTAPAKPKIEKIVFGGGCFWCSEAVFERIPGVKSVVSGYSGGSVENPTYEEVCTGLTGHAEVVQVEYDASVVSFDTLLNVFWKSHDPTTLNQQGPDFGTQYRSIILYTTDEQKLAAQKSYKDLTAKHAFRRPIVTELLPLKVFYPAEQYHQDYYNNHKGVPYSNAYIIPKLRKLKLKP